MDSNPESNDVRSSAEGPPSATIDDAGVDTTLVEQLLALDVEERIEMLSRLASSLLELRRAARI